ncbi:hypothetical protein RRG08_014657 [Elysia crispata]|uniref:Uncharacterized protein n=1 Tax=Elysia crispata TaxID=231223 RepID=A0AAE0YHY4_9GAST|nr:hypothetical protein RRG08_014657 [Elysia crispata]
MSQRFKRRCSAPNVSTILTNWISCSLVKCLDQVELSSHVRVPGTRGIPGPPSQGLADTRSTRATSNGLTDSER